MNHHIPPYNQNVQVVNHTDWGSMAKQWASLRANVNIPSSLAEVETYQYHNIPPPPPPPPCNIVQKPNPMPYSNEFKPILNHDHMMNYNRNNHNTHTNNLNANVYEPPMHSMYDEMMPSQAGAHCETFDYNHRDRPYANFNTMTNYIKPPSSANQFSHFNLPPPTHQDYMDSQQFKNPSQIQDLPPPKLFPIDVTKSQTHVPNHTMPVQIEPALPYIANKYEAHIDYSTTRSNKGLPAWIIDDMKKIKEKERKQPCTTMDEFRDHPVNSKRDEEGDIVMEDVLKESEMDGIMSGKSVISTNRIDNMATEFDIDDVNLNDEDDGFDKIDYSSKSLIDLIELLDESELETLKIVIIRDSLTGVMKQVTDDIISEVVNLTFSHQLSKISSKNNKGVKGVPRDSKTVNCNSDATVKSIDTPAADLQNQPTSNLLGLDVYESDDEINGNVLEESKKEANDRRQATSESRQKWSSHRKSSEVTKKSSVYNSNDKDHREYLSSQSKEKKISSSDTSYNKISPSRVRKRSKSRETSRKRSRSRDRHRSPEYRRTSKSRDRNHSPSHKKSKKSHHSPDWRDSKWKNDKCERSSIDSKKRSKRDRSRS